MHQWYCSSANGSNLETLSCNYCDFSKSWGESDVLQIVPFKYHPSQLLPSHYPSIPHKKLNCRDSVKLLSYCKLQSAWQTLVGPWNSSEPSATMVWAGFEYKVGVVVKAALYSVSSAASLRQKSAHGCFAQQLPKTAQASKLATRLGLNCTSAHTAWEEVCLRIWTEIN